VHRGTILINVDRIQQRPDVVRDVNCPSPLQPSLEGSRTSIGIYYVWACNDIEIQHRHTRRPAIRSEIIPPLFFLVHTIKLSCLLNSFLPYNPVSRFMSLSVLSEALRNVSTGLVDHIPVEILPETLAMAFPCPGDWFDRACRKSSPSLQNGERYPSLP
jgi:hypothetical protein